MAGIGDRCPIDPRHRACRCLGDGARHLAAKSIRQADAATTAAGAHPKVILSAALALRSARLLGLSRQPLDRLDAIAHPHLLVEMSDVVLDGTNRETEPSGDLLVGKPLAHVIEHLLLAVAECVLKLCLTLRQQGTAPGLR